MVRVRENPSRCHREMHGKRRSDESSSSSSLSLHRFIAFIVTKPSSWTECTKIAIATVFHCRGQIAGKFRRKSDFRSEFAESIAMIASEEIRALKSQCSGAGNRSDFWPAMEIRNCNQKNARFRCTKPSGGNTPLSGYPIILFDPGGQCTLTPKPFP